MFGLSKLVSRILIGAVVVILLLGFLQVRSCQQARQKAAQSKVDRGQAGALRSSATDAIETVSNIAEAASESEALGRRNAEEIGNAQGADDRVNPAVRDAGVRAICRRASSRNDPRCRVQ